MMGTTWSAQYLLVAAFIVVFALWLTLSCLVIINRLVHEHRRRSIRSVADTVDVDQLLRTANAEHKGRRWRRISALATLADRHPQQAYDALERALHGEDPDVAISAATHLHRIGDRRAAAVLISALRVRPRGIPASRVATHLDRFPVPIDDLLRPLLTDSDRDRRYWAAALLGRYADVDGLPQDLAPLTDDEHPPVRKAAMTSLASMTAAVAEPVARRKLRDAVPYVRSAAVRALGRLGSGAPPARRRDIAEAITPMLADARWEVRLAARESLMELGPAVWQAVAAVLDSRDEFARNGAAEVLQDLGIVDWTLGGLAHGFDVSQELRTTVKRALRDGGSALADAAALRAPDAIDQIVQLVPGHPLAGAERE